MSLLKRVITKRNRNNRRLIDVKLRLEQVQREKAIEEQRQQRIKEVEEKQKVERERLLNSEDFVPNRYVIGLSEERTEIKNGITYKYNHVDYYLSDILALDTFITYDKFKIKQLTGENIGAEYACHQINTMGFRKYKVTDYRGNAKILEASMGIDAPMRINSLNELAKKLNSMTAETCYNAKVKEIREQETIDKLFGV